MEPKSLTTPPTFMQTMATSINTSYVCDYLSLSRLLKENNIEISWCDFEFSIDEYTKRLVLSELAKWMFVKDGLNQEFVVDHCSGSQTQTILCKSVLDGHLLICCEKKVEKNFLGNGQKGE